MCNEINHETKHELRFQDNKNSLKSEKYIAE
jgi:hypothetical protein